MDKQRNKTDKDKIAIYTRKSKYSDKSESIDSQIGFCRQFAKARYPGNDNFAVYSDEGFSGANADRPQYKILLEDIKSGEFLALICYKIDRISRSLADFTALQQYLLAYGVNIISASEGFDTSTSWGQAVLNILMIFAQLERGNVSERVKDTMLYYGRQGRWTGGLTPTGFKSCSVECLDSFGQIKKAAALCPVNDELETVRLIYGKYIKLQSLKAVATALIEEGVKTKKGKLFSAATVRNILINPVYAVADKELYNFFLEKGAEICGSKEDFDGKRAVLPYNREDKKSFTTKPIEQWIIALSRHRGIISGKDWIFVQKTIEKNSDKKPRLGTGERGIFSGLIKCKCGSIMRVKSGRREKGEFYYVCRLKEQSRGEKCIVKNIPGHVIEEKILEKIDAAAPTAPIQLKRKCLLFENNEKANRISRYQSQIAQKKLEIANLVNRAAQASEEAAGKYIIERINGLDKEIKELSRLVRGLEFKHGYNTPIDISGLRKTVTGAMGGLEMLDITSRRSLIKLLIDEIVWDGTALTISFAQNDMDF